jgi:hypothetical protein
VICVSGELPALGLAEDPHLTADRNRSALADFNLRELRSDVVLRWQYRPRSALFLVRATAAGARPRAAATWSRPAIWTSPPASLATT